MDDSEKLAQDYLQHIGFKRIVFEPDGNVPPDFLVNERIAVEVRRLNQNELTESGFRGLEEVDIPLLERIQKLLISLGPSKAGASWFVCYKFKRPLTEWKELLPKLRQWLERFRDVRQNQKPTCIQVDDTFEIKLFPASTVHPTFFLLGSRSDGDSGGWVLSETKENLCICIEEKTRKIARVRHKYPEWWLLLIDRIGYGVDECDREQFRQHLKIEHDWDKVILLNPLDPRSAFEIP